MDITALNYINCNASRNSNLRKIGGFLNFLKEYDPIIVTIQEINIRSSLKIFSDTFQVIINTEPESRDGIGIVTLIKQGVRILDTIISKNGRIIGVKIKNAQIWNVYPKSGTAFKQARELFFREELCVLMVNWKDHTRYIFQSGDHNCTHRLSDSLNNGNQHLQPGLVKHMQIHGLSDDFVNVHGDVQMFSRITASSSTRIDFILSNSNACIYFQYVDMNAGLDHKVVLARYEISISLSREFIPQDRLFQGWVIHKMLENDEDFLNQAKYIFEKVGE